LLYPFLIPDLPPAAEWMPRFEQAFSRRIFSNFGPLARELEGAIAERYALPGYAAISCCSATVGLAVVLLSLFKPGGRIALPNFTFAATYQAIRMANLVPVVVDIDPLTYELDVASLAATMKSTRIDGVMPVRPFGFVRDQTELVGFCRENDLRVVFDSAACLGGRTLPKFGSTFGEIEVFSLHATKSFGVGEGGVILCPTELEGDIRRRLNFGFHPDRTFDLGFNGKMDELHAAVGLSQMDRIDAIQGARAEHARRYDTFFGNDPDTQLPAAVNPGSGWTMYPVVFKNLDVALVAGRAAEFGIETRRYYWPSIVAGAREPVEQAVDLKTSDWVSQNVLCFPVYAGNAAHLVDGLFLAMEKLFPRRSAGF